MRSDKMITRWMSTGAVLFGLIDVAFLLWGRHQFMSNWADASKSQITGAYLAFWAAGLGLIANTVLVFVTMVYVLKTSTLVAINADQHERFHTTYIEFGVQPMISREYQALGVWVANLGVSNFMVSGIEYTKSGEEPKVQEAHLVVPVGGIIEQTRLPLFFSKDNSGDKVFGVDVQIRIRTLRMGEEEWSSARGFHFRLQNDSPHAIERGYKNPRAVDCPKCNKWGFVYMVTEGLSDEASLIERTAEHRKHLAATCPDHSSPFSMV